MRKEKPLYILLGALFIMYVVVEYYSPKPIDWTITYSQNDKNPFGCFVLYDRLNDVFPNKSLSFNTLPQEIDSKDNLLILAQNINLSEVEIEAIFQILNQGRSVFIGGQRFSEDLLDTLGIKQIHNPFKPIMTDSVAVSFKNSRAFFPSTIINSHFELDSIANWSIHGQSDGPVLISKKFNKGNLVLSSSPLAFSNYGMLQKENYLFIAEALQLLPYANLTYNRYYQTGKPEVQTPLRYLLSVAALRWALYLSILVLIMYLFVNSRRLQKVIPVVEPPKNTTVHFIKTIGGLYYREGNHKHAAQKMINHFLKGISEKYHVYNFDEASFAVIAAKTGLKTEDVIHTFSLIKSLKQSQTLSEESLKILYEKIKLFNIQ